MKPYSIAVCCLFICSMLVRAELPRYSVSTINLSGLPQLGGDFTVPLRLVKDGLLVQSNTSHAAVVEVDTYAVRTDYPVPSGWYSGPTGGGVHDSGRFATALGDRPVGPGYIENIVVASYDSLGAATLLTGQVGIDPRAVNASGQVAGDGPEDATAWRFTPGSGWLNLGSLNSSNYAQAKGINNTGAVVGRTTDANSNTVPFLWTDGAGMEAITDGGTPVFGEATAVNNNGLVTGTANGRAFVFDGSTMELTWITPDGTGLKAYDINDAGVIIGATRMGGSIFGIPSDAAFYWDAENGLTGIDNLIGDAVNDWFITDATDINDDGWILATGFQRSDGTYHQVLLRPVPEPSVGLLAGLGVLWQIGRRKRAEKSKRHAQV